MKCYEIVVSNIGTITTTTDRKVAYKTYREYCYASKHNCGRASHETVTMFVDGDIYKEYQPVSKLPSVRDIRALLIDLKSTIGQEYRIEDQDDNIPTMQVTIGADNTGSWSYQTGDTSYTGGAYGYPHWGICYLQRRSNCTDLALDVISQIDESQWNC